MEAQAQVERGNALLVDGRPMEAAEAYARAVQAEPSGVEGHLGLAEANLALGAYATVYLASREVQNLAPGTADAALARAIVFVLERRYDAAIQELDQVSALDPGRAYAHALRGYCLRLLGDTYDAQQAEAKARRLSSGKDFRSLFPPAGPAPVVPSAQQMTPQAQANVITPAPEAPRNGAWEQQQRMMRARLASRGYPLATYTLIVVNIVIYVLTAISVGGNFVNPSAVMSGNVPFTSQQLGPIYYYGIEFGPVMQQSPLEWYRILTAMFLHASIAHVGLNMVSLYFVGVVTEQLFGRWRYLTLYFVTGILAGITEFVIYPDQAALGASGAIFGIFGAFGAFVILRRRVLGRASNSIIAQWIFWLVINLAYGFSPGSGIAVADHIGGLVSGFILGALLIPTFFKSSRFG